jgi:hypothetical protein
MLWKEEYFLYSTVYVESIQDSPVVMTLSKENESSHYFEFPLLYVGSTELSTYTKSHTSSKAEGLLWS